MIIQTTNGPIDAAELDAEPVLVDDEKWFASGTLYRFKGTRDKAAFVGISFDKVEPAEASPPDGLILIEENGARSTVPVAGLEKKIVKRDTPDFYQCGVQYRRPGSDVVIHESAVASPKKLPAMGAQQGGF